jgi:hypothetical protein
VKRRRVVVIPLPPKYRALKDFRPGHPPIFPFAGEPTAEEIALARALYSKLDPESKAWYRGCRTFEGLD